MNLLLHTPSFSPVEIDRIALDHYGIKCRAAELPSERDQNFLITMPEGEKRVLKIANSQEEPGQIDAENQAMNRIAEKTGLAPRVIPAQNGEPVIKVQKEAGSAHLVRMISFLKGRPMGRAARHSEELLQNLGLGLGRMTKALAGFDHPAVHRDFHWDLAKAPQVVDQHLPLVREPEVRAILSNIRNRFELEVSPLLPGLRKSVIHNDANDYNIIVGHGRGFHARNQRLAGFVDFGDMVYSHTINELAIAAAYAVLNKPDPLAVAVILTKAFHQAFPLTEKEAAALFGLLQMRLAASACIAAYQQSQKPDHQYLSISQEPIRNALPRLAEIPWELAHAAFRKACRMEPSCKAKGICQWLHGSRTSFGPVLEGEHKASDYVVVDLGIGSHLIQGDPSDIGSRQIQTAIEAKLNQADAKVGIGSFLEPRIIYQADAFKAKDQATGEDRTVHLGLDLFAPAGTGVLAPFDGKVHAVGVNDQPLDYGGVLILKHQTDTGERFFTLYGHLAPESLSDLKPGRKIAKGSRLAGLGDIPENGGWPPHLHFQIITDLLDLDLGFPGVCRFSQAHLWSIFSPDPNLMLNLDQDGEASLFPEPKLTLDQALTLRKKRLGFNLSIGYHRPLRIERGWRQYLWDDTGRRFLDAYNNVPHVGHCHPKVVEAACAQISVLSTNTRYLHDAVNQYAELLTGTMPDPLEVCFFLNSASEANELAVRLARAYTSARDMIVLEAAYHGNTNTAIDLSPYKFDGPGGMGARDWVHVGPIADVYRGPYKANDPEAAEKYAKTINNLITGIQAKGKKLCGFIAETCPSVGGQIIQPRGYLPRVYEMVRRAGGVCIADEVQTGYGRLGTHFYAFEQQGAVPDIVVLGKPIGNGHPIGALVTSKEIARAFDNGMEFFSTFGGNTVSAVVGKTVLEVTLEENLQANALEVGTHLLNGLSKLKGRYPIIGDVRGQGLFLGVELIRDHETLEPAAEETSFIVDRMRDYGILAGTDGAYHNVVKIRPSMVITKQNADRIIETMERVLEEDFRP